MEAVSSVEPQKPDSSILAGFGKLSLMSLVSLSLDQRNPDPEQSQGGERLCFTYHH